MMKTFWISLLLALFLAASPLPGQLIPGTVSSNAVVTVSTTPIGITCTDLGTGVTALIQTNGAGIRFTLNSETPNTSTSYLLVDGGFFAVGNPPGFKAIRSASTDATLKVSCIQR